MAWLLKTETTERLGNRQGGGAGGRQDQILALVDAIGVANGRVGSGKARPSRRAAQIGLCEIPESVALADFNCWGRGVAGIACWMEGCDNNRQIELGAGADLVRVDDARIDGKKFRVAIAAAEILLRQLPERIAGLDGHNILSGDRGGMKSGLRLHRANR